jgi:AcrR family transcriptional regulator
MIENSMSKKVVKKAVKSAPARRMGPTGSAIWNSILDGAEALLRDEGYAALTSRKVAERAGIRQQLVYYYFKTMEDLYTETFQRLAGREIERLSAALNSDRPLHETWKLCIHTGDSPLISEFMALAHRSEGVRKQVIAFIEESRRLQIDTLSRVMKRSASASNIASSQALAFIATSAALALTREADLGISLAHAETEALILQVIQQLESAPAQSAEKASPSTRKAARKA